MRLIVLVAILMGWMWRGADAATITPVWLDGGQNRAVVLINGRIVPGDGGRFVAAISSVAQSKPGARVVAVALNTPGGAVVEGKSISMFIAFDRLDTVLYPGATCASACAEMFLSGNRKIMGVGARIGVHRASTLDGVETASTLDTSWRMAKTLAGLGASQRVVDKLMGTPPGVMSWLSAEDLRGVRGLVFSPAPKSLPSQAFASGWDMGIRLGRPDACPNVLTQYADGCRAGAAAARSY
jgi:hypothetical protein